jgi:DNA-binding NtrC family response regulator
MPYALLIDDDHQITRSASDLVRDSGLTIETAGTWEEGISKFNAYAPDLVISDFHLPGSEMGLRLLIEMSRIKPSVRLILISAYLDEDDVARIKELNLVHDVVRKTDPVATARRILAEVRGAANRAENPTDWVSFARESSRLDSVDPAAITALDQFLKGSRLPGANGGAANA